MERTYHDSFKFNGKFYEQYIKRVLDFIFAFFGFIVLLPVFLIIAAAVKINSKGPVIFTQHRVGKDGHIFKVYKFRTMRVETHKDGRPLSDSERVTKLGRLIRKLSIDELPQLLNIVKGEMSFIGPRPLLVKYLPYYTQTEMERHSVRPGITGWAQVNGRNAIGWNNKFALDLEYVKNVSFAFDMKIVILTLIKIIKQSDVLDNYLPDLDVERELMSEGPVRQNRGVNVDC